MHVAIVLSRAIIPLVMNFPLALKKFLFFDGISFLIPNSSG